LRSSTELQKEKKYNFREFLYKLYHKINVVDPQPVLRIRIRIGSGFKLAPESGSGSSKGILAVLKPTKVIKFCKFNQIMSKGPYLFQFNKIQHFFRKKKFEKILL
jgi:hypothetical protein